MTRVRSAALPLLAVLTVLCAAPVALVAQGGSAPRGVAYVAIQAVLQRTPGYAQAESTWTAEVAGYQRQMTELQARLDSASAAFEQQSVMLSPSNRAVERKKLEDQAGVMQQQVADLRQKASERQRELLDPIEQRVVAVIESLRVEGNYAVVFDVSSQGSNIVTADPALDLTKKAIDRLAPSAGSSGND
ncbi:MAG: OmpH family outer membrane protein [Gemmatimonadales bacterium]|nr:OmpH family outer membrane protein [Gemmatimonadota bacterium]MCA9768098.1 OmpH family outer membrane protein [Gemmatimonadota bacterium]MCB9504873.1 OmpH family outer membrane protein [Gemmatimonadales bacterium]MCB9518193.1 OmpH family outer membrane protein [Gemmatimonadales bacterium]HPF62432.1 OmpH family outer membrane protein [Gemmatimonadales bacterium]